MRFKERSHFHKIKYKVIYVVAPLVKNPPAIQETLVGLLGQEDPLEKK